MTEEQILKAFEGRWRIKSEAIIASNKGQDPITYDVLRKLCLDFFRAGILISDINSVANPPDSVIVVDTNRVHKFIPEDKQFDYWWNTYDKKRGREKCLKKWISLTSAERYACAAATPMYVASTPDKQYRKDPLTYLNGKCWNDEIINRNGNSTNNDPKSKLADILAP